MRDEVLGSVVQYITECYRKQHRLYDKLMLITGQISETEFGRDKDIDRIGEALTKREEIIKQIAVIDREVKSKRKEAIELFNLKSFKASDLAGLVNSDYLEDLVAQTTAISDIIRKIITLDNRNQEHLKGEIKNVAIELKKFQVHHDIQHVYLEQPSGFPEPRFFDKRE